MSRVGADERIPVPDSIPCSPPRRATLNTTTGPPLTIEVLPGASHKMRTGAGTRLASGYLHTLTRWIKAWTGISPDT